LDFKNENNQKNNYLLEKQTTENTFKRNRWRRKLKKLKENK